MRAGERDTILLMAPTHAWLSSQCLIARPATSESKVSRASATARSSRRVMCSSRSELFQKPRAVLSTRAGSPLTSRDCVDYGVEVGGPRDEIVEALFR